VQSIIALWRPTWRGKFKRVGWSELRANAEDDDQAYATRNALDPLREALKQAGYAPR